MFITDDNHKNIINLKEITEIDSRGKLLQVATGKYMHFMAAFKTPENALKAIDIIVKKIADGDSIIDLAEIKSILEDD